MFFFKSGSIWVTFDQNGIRKTSEVTWTTSGVTMGRLDDVSVAPGVSPGIHQICTLSNQRVKTALDFPHLARFPIDYRLFSQSLLATGYIGYARPFERFGSIGFMVSSFQRYWICAFIVF